MHYTTLVRQLAKHHRVTQTEARRHADNVFRLIKLAVSENQHLRVPRFGTFYLRTVNSRVVKLPNGENALVPLRRVVAFRASRV